MTPLQNRLLEIVTNFPGKKIVIVGDSIADRFLYGSISRVSREAPVFILRHEQTETVPGGAANSAVNLASLDARVSLVSAVGHDQAGSELRTKLDALGVDTDSLLTAENLQTTTKVRILAGHAHSNRQQVIRIDYEDSPITDREVRSKLLSELKRRTSDASAVIVSDYNYGVVDDAEVEFLLIIRKSMPVLVDSRFRLTALTGLTAATPNEDELEQIIKEPIGSREHLEAAATKLQHQLNYQALLVT